MSKAAESALPVPSSRVSRTPLTSDAPRFEDEATRPGVTTPPLASITLAPAGTATLAPRAAILPSLITRVPFGIAAVETGSMRALTMATVSAAAGRASAQAALARSSDRIIS